MLKAALWFVFSLLISISNDSCVKYIANYLPSTQIIFLRFALSALLLLPFVIKKRLLVNKVAFLQMFFRGAITALAMLLWCKGLKEEFLVSATIIGFIIPFLVLMMSRVLLNEELKLGRVVISSIAFIGVLIAHYSNDNNNIHFNHYLILAAVIFAFIDILNKKYINHVAILVTMFYVFLGASLISFFPAIIEWEQVSTNIIFTMIILILGTNLILFALLKSMTTLEASLTAPLRFIELLFSIGFGAVFFDETPSFNMILGGIIVISSLIIYTLQEIQKKKILSVKKSD